MPVVTLSASFGAGGSQVGPLLAERLQVEFLDRAIPVAVAERLQIPLDDAISHEQPVAGVLDRLLASFAPIGGLYGSPVGLEHVPEDHAYAAATEEVIKERAARGGVVILGRAGAVVLREHPEALHVRLDGPREARVRAAMRREGMDEEAAKRKLEQTDRAREAYVQQFYGQDARDPGLYHLQIDSTRFGVERVVDLIVASLAAR